MRVFLILLILVSASRMASAASNAEFASLYNKTEVEHKEMLGMSHDENTRLNKCVNDLMEEGKDDDLDFSEATDGCINEVLGDIHN